MEACNRPSVGVSIPLGGSGSWALDECSALIRYGSWWGVAEM
jgi:hypothetical protein